MAKLDENIFYCVLDLKWQFLPILHSHIPCSEKIFGILKIDIADKFKTSNIQFWSFIYDIQDLKNQRCILGMEI